MNHGLNDKTVETIHHILAHFPQVETALIYGSRAKGTYKPGSDIDLTLTGPDLTPQLLHQIQSDLDDTSLPYRFDISILSALTNPQLIDHIRRVGIPLYQKNSVTTPNT
jgi:uncharacterized protein